MDQPITIGMLLKGVALYYTLPVVVFLIIGIPFILHQLSGGEWPAWYKRLKHMKNKHDNNSDPIKLNL